ncbi:MAG TPA: cell envelope integrity protein TolA, partial [Chlorobaculum parvum]|nr:cell envelope integrity protein TolA [Chlorobaculum parvum]
MQSRDELRLEERRFYVWLGVAAAAHLALIVSVVFFQLLYVRMHPPLKVVNVSLVSMPGRPGPAGGPKSIPASPAEDPEAKASDAEPPAVKKVPEPSQPKPEPKVPEPSTVKKIPEKPPVAKAP